MGSLSLSPGLWDSRWWSECSESGRLVGDVGGLSTSRVSALLVFWWDWYWCPLCRLYGCSVNPVAEEGWVALSSVVLWFAEPGSRSATFRSSCRGPLCVCRKGPCSSGQCSGWDGFSRWQCSVALLLSAGCKWLRWWPCCMLSVVDGGNRGVVEVEVSAVSSRESSDPPFGEGCVWDVRWMRCLSESW